MRLVDQQGFSKMTRTATVTFHRANNNGSFLQTYALQQTLLKFDGVSNEIIDYQTESQVHQYQVIKKNNSMMNLLRNMISCLNYKKIKKRKQDFDKLYNQYFILSQKYYSENDQLEELESQYDVFITGSDQIWNVNARDYSEAYFLNFVKAKKRIAYAPSFGSVIEFNDQQTKSIRDSLEKFDEISLREIAGKNFVDGLIDRDVPVVLDPTLLLAEKEYSILEKKERSINGKYIFFYSINYNLDSLNVVRKFANIYNLPVVVVFTSYHVYKCTKYGFQIIKEAAPDTFLELVKNAEYILSNSFHGTAFALIYRKQFYTIAQVRNDIVVNDDRIDNLLGICNLRNRCLTSNNKEEVYQQTEIDYKLVDGLLNAEVQKSINTLKNMLFN